MLTKKDLRYLELAKLQTNKSIDYYHKIGAVLANKNKIYYGFNKRKTHPMQYKYRANQYKIFIHAEIDCISKIKEDKKDFVLYVVRKTRSNTYSCSKPCKGCIKAIREAGIRKVIYLDFNGNPNIIYL